jgi:hypothetical protein
VSNVLARDLRHALDPVAFAVERLGFSPDPWQARMLRSGRKRQLLNCTRQGGKSTTTAIKALHTAEYLPGALVLLVSKAQRQSSELFAKVATFRDRLGAEAADLEEDNKLSMTLPNKSRVVSLPGSPDTIRGFSAPALVVVDEAAVVDDTVFPALLPMLATSGGRLVLMSTPSGRRGYFFEAWENGGDDWERISIKAEECPRIPREFLAEQRRLLGDYFYRQEYGCEFLETQDQLFRLDDIRRAVTAEVKPLFPAFSPAVSDAVKPLFPNGVSP